MKEIRERYAVQCDVQLEDWTEREDEPCKITLCLNDRSRLAEIVNALSGGSDIGPSNMFRLFLVGVEDQASPIDEERAQRLEEVLSEGPLSRRASVLSRDTAFWAYLETVDLVFASNQENEKRARQYIDRVCHVDSRLQLDYDEDAAARFRVLIQAPFLSWLRMHAQQKRVETQIVA